MPLVGIQRRKQEMNDNFYIAVSARAILKDGKRKGGRSGHNAER